MRKRARFSVLALDVVEGLDARVLSGVLQLFLDAEQLIVLGNAVGTAGSARLNLARIAGNREVGDGSVLGLTGTMRHNARIACLLSHLNGFQSLSQRANLVHLNQDCVSAAQFDAFGQTL